MGDSTKERDMIPCQIHQQAINMNTKIMASYFSGVKNWQADQLSRLKSTYKWKLHPNLFSSDQRLLGSTHNGQVSVIDDNTDSQLQQFILGSIHKLG